MKIVFSFIIQLLWVVVALLTGSYLSMNIFDNLLLRCLFGGVFSVAIYFFLYVFTQWVKAMRDPDVLIASDLRMSVKRYRLYQRIYDEYHTFMMEHGTDSPASERKFKELFKEVENPNEWKRYQQYRYDLFQKERTEQLQKYENQP